MKDVDDFVELLGTPNKYSALVIFLLCFMYFPLSFNHLLMAVYGAVPPHRCQVPDGLSLNDSIPRLENGDYDSCKVYVNYSQESDMTESCPNGWHYDLLDGESTVVNEWDLVCDRFYLGPLSGTIYFICNMVGALLLGPLSDRFGRKTVLLTVIYLHIIVGFMVYFVESFTLFVILRGLIGLLVVGGDNAIVMALEWVQNSRSRTNVNTIFLLFWALGVATLGLIAYGLKHWRNIQLAITIPCVLLIGYIWCIPESIRWLMTRGHFHEAEKCLVRGAKFNGVSLPTDSVGFLYTSHTDGDTTVQHLKPKHTLLELFRQRTIRKLTLIMSYTWMATGLVYYGLSLNASDIAGDKYVNFIVSGLVELPPVFAAFYVLQRFGRKPVLAFYGFSSGIMCIVSGVIPHKIVNGVDLALVASGFAWMGKLFSNGSWTVIILYSAELFPTSMRNTAILFCDVWARIGSIVATQIALLAAHSADWVPPTIMGVSALIMGCLVLFLPETLHTQFPDVAKEVEHPDQQLSIIVRGNNPVLQTRI